MRRCIGRGCEDVWVRECVGLWLCSKCQHERT